MPLPSLENAKPFFQPIIRADDQEVFAYEVLARDISSKPARSLGHFFEDKHVLDEDKLALDTHLRNLALEKYAQANTTAKLFINLKPSWVYAQKDTQGQLPGISLLEHFKIDPKNIVLEITEEEMLGDFEAVSRILARYRQAGCMLAIDDFGKGASSIERIAYITPDILKLDSSIVQRMDTQRAFFDICKAMSSFGDVSGFDLLFEGVETAYQLERCIAAQGRYFQGFIFSKARQDMDGKFENYEMLCDLVSIQGYKNNIAIIKRKTLEDELSKEIERLKDFIPQDIDALNASGSLTDFGNALPYYCIRCFVCDMKGVQLSSVYQFGKNGSVTEYKGRRASWLRRNFFLFGLDALHGEQKGFLSDIYKNVFTKENVATYMYKIGNSKLLCVDIMSTQLI